MTDETPGAYGYRATRAHREQVEAEITRQRAQAARRRNTRPEQETDR